MAHPRRAARDPLKGAAPEARQSRFLGATGRRHLVRSAAGLCHRPLLYTPGMHRSPPWTA
ncbi:MAG: hypothetical protein C0453_21685 [Comamonadaceae bacterium]|nr:hypothetical protein [Comamonadaceae bacterium]